MAVTQLFSPARLDRAASAAPREPSRAGSTRVERPPAFRLDGAEAAESTPVPKSVPPRSEGSKPPAEESRPAGAGRIHERPPSRSGDASTAPSDKPAPAEPPANEPKTARAPHVASSKADEVVARPEEDEARETASDKGSTAEAPIAMPEAVPRPVPPPPPVSTGAAPTFDAEAEAETPPVGAARSSGAPPLDAAAGTPTTARGATVVADPKQVASSAAGTPALGGLGSVEGPSAGAAVPPAAFAAGAEQDPATLGSEAAVPGISSGIGAEDGSTVAATGARRRLTPAVSTALPGDARVPSPLAEPAQAVATADAAPAGETDGRAEPSSETSVAPSAGKEPVTATEQPNLFAAASAPAPPAPATPSPALAAGIEAGVTGAVPSAVADAGPAAAASATATASAAPPVPLGAVPMTIAMRALQDAKRFEIRLDPIELGRIDVRLDIDRQDGSVRADLVVDRPATLALLQRDAGLLQNALSQAGLDASAGISLSLRDGSAGSQNQNPSQGQEQGGRGAPERGPLPPSGQRPARTSIDGPAPIWLRPIGIDIRI